jgi:hypothetical protein
MSDEQIESAAFHEAELLSERVRIHGMLGVLAVFMLETLVRAFLVGTAPTNIHWVGRLVLVSVILLYELWVLHRVNSRSLSEKLGP